MFEWKDKHLVTYLQKNSHNSDKSVIFVELGSGAYPVRPVYWSRHLTNCRHLFIKKHKIVSNFIRVSIYWQTFSFIPWFWFWRKLTVVWLSFCELVELFLLLLLAEEDSSAEEPNPSNIWLFDNLLNFQWNLQQKLTWIWQNILGAWKVHGIIGWISDLRPIAFT